MGRVIRNDIASLSALVSRVNVSNYNSYQKALIESKHDTDFSYATDIIPIQKETPFASGLYVDVIARAQRVNVPDKAQFLGDDFRKLLFKDVNESVFIGQKFIIDDEYWLCHNTNNLGSVTKSCHIRKCNHSLKWKDAYGIIRDEPCIIEYFKFTITNNAIEFDKMMRLGGNLRLLIVQTNQYTSQLKRDMRFIFNDMAWRITNVEKITHNGLTEMTVEEHQIDKTYDDLVDNIADYTAPTKFIIEVKDNVSTLLLSETSVILYTVFYDGIEVTEICVITSSDESIVSIDENVATAEAVGTASIRVSLEANPLIYSEYDVSVEEVTESPYIFGSDIVLFNGTYRYIVNNPFDSEYVFTSGDNTILITRVSDFSCDVKIPNIKKTFVLTATGDTGVITKSIDIRSMW